MRLVVGIDPLAGALVPELLANTHWPDGAMIRLVTACDPAFDWMNLGGDTAALAAAERDAFNALQRIAEPLRARGYATESVAVRGRPADVLLEEAGALHADLLVVGNRGRGAAASALLGSVSATLVDQASCPVLVVRRPSVGRILVATDGSPSAETIPSVLSAWGLFRAAPIDVLSVAPHMPPAIDSVVGPWVLLADDPRAAEPLTPGEQSQVAADRMADRFRQAGWQAVSHARAGDPAHVIEAMAAEVGADLVVTGSRGLNGVERWILGSVAHQVLLHTYGSVLVMRGRVRAREQRRAEVRAREFAI